jgi:diguanylate cyclase (GGDEF)-like protein
MGKSALGTWELNMRSLVVEHDPVLTAILVETLKAAEFAPEKVSGVKEALSAIEQGNGDVRVVVAPYEGADLDGMTLINSLLAMDIQAYPYILFLIEDDSYQRVLDSLGPIPGDYLMAPFTQEAIKARLQIAERTLALQERLQSSNFTSESLAIYDHLTGVLNRQAVYERALAEHNRAQRERLGMCIAMIDVRNLEAIREEHGPQVRDQALRFVARATRANVRLYDLVGRWIGSKFFVMLPGATPDNARTIVERINKSITAVTIRLPEGGRITLEVRIGFTSIDQERTLPLYVLIEQANDALLQAAGSDSEPVRLFLSPE